ncbi:MAG: type II toxin-antitoxin system VapC family toxin [Pyrinomonadaceae bacterium]
MADFTIIDTDILIDAGRGVSEAVACLQEIEQNSSMATSVVTQMELFVGCRNKTELQEVEKFLRRFQILKLIEPISDTAVELLRQYRLSHGLLIADALIASTALVFDAPLISKNQRDYRFIADLNLRAYS